MNRLPSLLSRFCTSWLSLKLLLSSFKWKYKGLTFATDHQVKKFAVEILQTSPKSTWFHPLPPRLSLLGPTDFVVVTWPFRLIPLLTQKILRKSLVPPLWMPAGSERGLPPTAFPVFFLISPWNRGSGRVFAFDPRMSTGSGRKRGRPPKTSWTQAPSLSNFLKKPRVTHLFSKSRWCTSSKN